MNLAMAWLWVGLIDRHMNAVGQDYSRSERHEIGSRMRVTLSVVDLKRSFGSKRWLLERLEHCIWTRIYMFLP
jgi:hypothetical protein